MTDEIIKAIKDLAIEQETYATTENYLNHGKWKRCKGTSIKDVIEYLSQFPPDWNICAGGVPRQEITLVSTGLQTVLTEIGKEDWGSL